MRVGIANASVKQIHRHPERSESVMIGEHEKETSTLQQVNKQRRSRMRFHSRDHRGRNRDKPGVGRTVVDYGAAVASGSVRKNSRGSVTNVLEISS